MFQAKAFRPKGPFSYEEPLLQTLDLAFRISAAQVTFSLKFRFVFQQM